MIATRLHDLDRDIRGLKTTTVVYLVNQRGEYIERVFIDLSEETPAGWECLACQATFNTWPSVEAHLKESVREKNI